MIIASGFVELNDTNDIERIIGDLIAHGVEVSETKDGRIVFLIEKESTEEIKRALDSLKEIDGIRNVNLAYYTLEGSDKE
jgi:nitrate reductase NapAB chaperone NapD